MNLSKMTNLERWGGPFRPYFHVYSRQSKGFKSHVAEVPVTIAKAANAYCYPKTYDGTGQTIGFLELGGRTLPMDLTAAGVNPARVTSLYVDGSVPSTVATDADGEVALDTQVAGVMAPGANLLVAYGPNTEQGFLDTYNALVPKSTVISISWGGEEDQWSSQGRTAIASAIAEAYLKGIPTCVAAGDNGFTDGNFNNLPKVDFPSSAPYAIACGGTALYLSSIGYGSETVWNDLANGGGATGGGVSALFKKLPWQIGCDFTQIGRTPTPTDMRLVPDIGMNAAPGTGYPIYVGGTLETVGGTSGVAPAFAALLAIIQQANGGPIQNLIGKMYAHRNTATEEAYFHENVSGDNGLFATLPHRYDCCVGLGSPNGQALLKLLTSK